MKQLRIQSIIFSSILIIFYNDAIEAQEPIVTIKNGTLRGSVLQNIDGKSYNAFRAIPYAKAPTGELRFEPPRPPEKWEGILDATKDGTECPQVLYFTGGYKGSEDCLILNIYTPHKYIGKRLPVMVFIHGGGFIMGTGNSYVQGPEKLMNLDVVLVALNYRLGILGFLSTEDDNAPGNYGLLDQVQALRWIKENIEQFGGDSSKVLIFGVSAGGGSVSYLMLSPLAKGLFHAAIAQSGTTQTEWALQKNPLSWAEKIAVKLNCSSENTKKLVDCFKAASVEELVIQSASFANVGWFPIYFSPVIEPLSSGRFITEEPKVLLEKGQIASKVPFITGIVKNEGYLSLIMMEKTFKTTGEEFLNYEFVTNYLRYLAPVNLEIKDIGSVVRKEYYGNQDVNDRQIFLDGLEQILADTLFTVGTDVTLKLMAKAGVPTYAYHYVCQTQNATNISIGYFPSDKVTHGAINSLLFRVNFFPDEEQPPESETDKLMTKILTTVWKNFAETKKPSFVGTPIEDQTLEWLQYNEDNPNYLEIDTTLRMREGVFCNRTRFWTETIPNLVNYGQKDDL